eukprot:756773_1
MWNSSSQPQGIQQPPPPIHQQPPQHHFNANNINNNNNNGNINPSLHQPPQVTQLTTTQQETADSSSLRAKDLNSWCEAFDKHELVDILVKISKTNTQFQSYLGHAFVTDIKWCKIRVTFTPSSSINNSFNNICKPPTSHQIQEYFNQYGNIRRIECFPSINSALITFENYTYAQSAVSVGIHENVNNTQYNASCCYEFEGNDNNRNIHNIQQNNNQNNMSNIGGPLEQRRIFVSSLPYNTSDET